MAPRRVLASTVLVAILCLIGQGLTLSHFLFVDHAACPVHPGELLELASNAPRAQAEPIEAAPGMHAAPVEAPECGSHDHCQVLGRRNEGLVDVWVGAVAVADPPLARYVAPQLDEPADVARLLVAPKQSPPHC